MRSGSLFDSLYLFSTSYCSNLCCAWRSKSDDVHVQSNKGATITNSDDNSINNNSYSDNKHENVSNTDNNNNSISHKVETASRLESNTTNRFHHKKSAYENRKWYWDKSVERHLHPPVRFRPISETLKYINLKNKNAIDWNEEEMHQPEKEELERKTFQEKMLNSKEDEALNTLDDMINDNSSHVAMSGKSEVDSVANMYTCNNDKDNTGSRNNYEHAHSSSSELTHATNDFSKTKAKTERAKRSSASSTRKVITSDMITTIEGSSNSINTSDENSVITNHEEINSSELSSFAECTEESLATMSQTETLFESIHAQTEQSRYELNQLIPFPPSPEAMVPEFRRIKKHARLKILTSDEENYPTFDRRDVSITLPPSPKHPWLPYCPIGPHIVHGDGAINMTGGTGEVGFEDYDKLKLTTSDDNEEEIAAASVLKNQTNVVASSTPSLLTEAQTLTLNQQSNKSPKGVSSPDNNRNSYNSELDANNEPLRRYPKSFRGLQHHTILNHHLPQQNGTVLQDMVIRYSFGSTGRGIFATRDIKKGEVLMIVQSTAQSLGVKGEVHRLEEMCVDVLLTAYEECCAEKNAVTADESNKYKCHETKEFLHSWIFNGQPSSLLEHWPAASTTRVIYAIGGYHVLHALELHPVHIARLAAIIDMNSYLVESYYAHRKGMAYFPEAGYLNHSCTPNASYEIMPEHVFSESEYNKSNNISNDDVSSNNEEELKQKSTEEGEEEKEEEEEYELLEMSKMELSTQQQKESKQENVEYEQKQETHNYYPSSSNFTASPSESTTCNELPMKEELPECNTPENKRNEHTLMPLREKSSHHHHHLLRVNAARNATYLKELAEGKVNLTSSGAPTYLFCCRAERDIAANEEVFISYVPTTWTFNARQQVLHDRYKFWCKCEKCSPYVDERTMKIARWTLWVLAFFMFLQVVVYSARKMRNLENEDIQNALMHNANYEARQRELEKRGININYFEFINNKTTSSPNAQVPPYGLNEGQTVNDDILASLHNNSNKGSNNNSNDNKHKSSNLSNSIRRKKLDSLFERENTRGTYQSRVGDDFFFQTPRKMY